MQHKTSDWIILIVLVIIWGSAFMFTKLALANFPPTTFVAFRLIMGAIILLIVLFFQRRAYQSITPREYFIFTIMAILGNALPFFSISWGQQYVDSSLAGILMAVMPLATLFLSHFFLPDERLNSRRLFGFLLGFAGVVILLNPKALLTLDMGNALKAELAILFGAFCYAINTIIARKKAHNDDLLTSAYVLTIASVFMLPISINIEDPWINLPITPLALFSLLFMGVLATALATVFYFRLIRSAGPAFLSQINYLIPVWAMLVGAIFMGETIHLSAVFALVLLLTGLTLANTNRETCNKETIR